jgi:hypothetical protein
MGTEEQKQAFEQAERDYASEVFGDVPCLSCIRYVSGRKCRVYPDGIPLEIVDGSEECESYRKAGQ